MKEETRMLLVFAAMILLVTFLASALTGCSYRLDTNGYYSKNVNQKPVKCVEVNSSYTKCSSK